MERNFDKKRDEISKERKIYCDGAATIDGNGGWMFFTEEGIEFYPHKINVSTNPVMIPVNTMTNAQTHRNAVVINTVAGSQFKVIVAHNKEWVKQINGVLADISNNHQTN